jgi:choline dehydrogenase-like flavoprotein
MMEERAPDDPWGALRRLVRINSARPLSDLLTVLAGSSLVLKGMAAHLLTDGGLPKGLTGPIIETLVRHAPNSVVREYRGRGLPHKLAGVSIDAITEQAPNPDSRITLSEDVDPLGVPRAKVDWRIDGEAYHAMIRMGQVLARELPKVGLPTPILPNWVAEERPDLAPVIDMAHSAGTTRMSNDPRQGVVDADGAVFGLNNLYIAGASVFPTSGHANPTLMIMAMSIRLADHLRAAIKQPVVLRVAQRSAGAVRPGAVLPAAAQRAGEKSRRRIKSDL